MQQIIDLPYKQNARNGGQPVFNLAKDLFILSFAMMGMNSADFYNAPTVENGIISYQRTKTRTRREDKAEMKVRIEPEIKNCLRNTPTHLERKSLFFISGIEVQRISINQ